MVQGPRLRAWVPTLAWAGVILVPLIALAARKVANVADLTNASGDGGFAGIVVPVALALGVWLLFAVAATVVRRKGPAGASGTTRGLVVAIVLFALCAAILLIVRAWILRSGLAGDAAVHGALGAMSGVAAAAASSLWPPMVPGERPARRQVGPAGALGRR